MSYNAARLLSLGFVLLLGLSIPCFAVSPLDVQQGKLLFERQWLATNPTLGSDGLGPLFNADSCVACHHQGGVGGSGDSRFNAVSLGIESVEFKSSGGSVRLERADATKMISQLYAGFVQPDDSVSTSAPVHHHGGTPQFRVMRSNMRQHAAGLQTPEGGPSDASEVRSVLMQPIVFSSNLIASHGIYDGVLRARVFQRNTTSLFGAGLIDAIPVEFIKKQATLQRRHPEVSGRPSILQDGTLGRFGWRANVNQLVRFVDQACTNEMGLQTKRQQQQSDPTLPFYQNPGTDIDDRQIQAMTNFIAALPAPQRQLPSGKDEIASVKRGEMLFKQVGCAVCHVPDLGPAKGIFSDLLLHDMGQYLYDLDAAEPYVLNQRVTTERRTSERRVTTMSSVGYYGSATSLDNYVVESPNPRTLILRAPRGSYKTTDFISKQRFTDADLENARAVEQAQKEEWAKFDLPSRPSNGAYGSSLKQNLVRSHLRNPKRNAPLSSEELKERSSQSDVSVRRPGPLRSPFRRSPLSNPSDEFMETGIRRKLAPSETSQEWRTPPLWGVRDSAPYMHDGRAETLLEAISVHGGEADGSRDRFLSSNLEARNDLLLFLNTLVAPSTAPKLDL